MGAYKNYQKQKEGIEQKALNMQYALLGIGMQVRNAALNPDGTLNKEDLKKNPQKYMEMFSQTLAMYTLQNLGVSQEELANTPQSVLSKIIPGLVKSNGVSPDLIEHFINDLIPKDKLLDFNQTIRTDRAFQEYHMAQQKDMQTIKSNLNRAYGKDRLGTVDEALKELGLDSMIDARAVGTEDFDFLEQLGNVPAKRLEEVIRENDPRLLKSTYNPSIQLKTAQID